MRDAAGADGIPGAVVENYEAKKGEAEDGGYECEEGDAGLEKGRKTSEEGLEGHWESWISRGHCVLRYRYGLVTIS